GPVPHQGGCADVSQQIPGVVLQPLSAAAKRLFYWLAGISDADHEPGALALQRPDETAPDANATGQNRRYGGQSIIDRYQSGQISAKAGCALCHAGQYSR